MHQSVMDFVLENMNRYGWHDVERILEVGSYNVNGTVRHDFAPEEYIGIDIAEGPCVDIVMSSHRLQRRFGWDAFDLVLCLEMLEHDRAPWTTVREMLKVCRPGGYVCATARGNGFGEHNNPDCYRFMEEGWNALFADAGWEVLEVRADPQAQGWFMVARKPENHRDETQKAMDRLAAKMSTLKGQAVRFERG